MDLVLDLIEKETQQRSLAVIKAGGILVRTVAPEYKDEAKEKHIRLESFTAQSYPEDLERIGELIDQGVVQSVVSAVFNLDDARKAEELAGTHHTRGKIVIKVI